MQLWWIKRHSWDEIYYIHKLNEEGNESKFTDSAEFRGIESSQWCKTLVSISRTLLNNGPALPKSKLPDHKFQLSLNLENFDWSSDVILSFSWKSISPSPSATLTALTLHPLFKKVISIKSFSSIFVWKKLRFFFGILRNCVGDCWNHFLSISQLIHLLGRADGTAF